MSTHLDKILATTRATVAAAKARVPLAELERLAAAAPAARMGRLCARRLPLGLP
jgi:hypothetical protein